MIKPTLEKSCPKCRSKNVDGKYGPNPAAGNHNPDPSGPTAYMNKSVLTAGIDGLNGISDQIK